MAGLSQRDIMGGFEGGCTSRGRGEIWLICRDLQIVFDVFFVNIANTHTHPKCSGFDIF